MLRDEVRPFARSLQPFQRDLGAASADLAAAGPDMTKAFRGLNRLFDIGAYNPNGSEGISEACELEGQCTRDERAERGVPLLAGLARAEHRVALLDG